MATASTNLTTAGDQQASGMSSGSASTGAEGAESGTTVIQLEDFLSTGRTGRRNALPDIQSCSWAGVSTAELPTDFSRLSCEDSNQAAASSGSTSGPPT